MTTPADTITLNRTAEKLWSQGRKHDAIRHLIDIINQTPQKMPRNICLQLGYYFFLGQQFSAAEKIIGAFLDQNPEDNEALENRGVLRLLMGNLAGAYRDFQHVVTYRSTSVNAWDGLTSALSQLGQTNAAKQAGSKVLTLKDSQCEMARAVQIHWPDLQPQTWDDQHRDRTDVISFSLWGNHPLYLRGAVLNLLEAPKLYPGWVCRFYIDSTVPPEFSRLATQLGGQVIVEKPGQPLRNRLGWRFQVASDPTVRRFLVRDADSLISEREVHAVQAWLASDRWFHVMRDWWSHTDLVLAGMWGGRAGLLEPLLPKLCHYQSGKLETANVDQWFLRDCVWAAIRESCLIHDRYFSSLGALPWPDPAPEGDFHVGQAVKSKRQIDGLGDLIQQYQWLQMPELPIQDLRAAA